MFSTEPSITFESWSMSQPQVMRVVMENEVVGVVKIADRDLDNNTNLQPNQQPSLAEIDGEIGREGLGLECVEDRLQANAQAGDRQWRQARLVARDRQG